MEAQLEEQAEDGASGDGGSQKALREYLDKVGVVSAAMSAAAMCTYTLSPSRLSNT